MTQNHRFRCPACGYRLTLEDVVLHDAAREAIAAVVAMGGPFLRAVVRYLSMHRPASNDLSMARFATLLNQLRPDMQSQRIERNGQSYPAPPEAWIWAIEKMIGDRDQGRLKLPLKGHGYLYEVLTSWRPEQGSGVVAAPVLTRPQPASKSRGAIAALEERISGGR